FWGLSDTAHKCPRTARSAPRKQSWPVPTGPGFCRYSFPVPCLSLHNQKGAVGKRKYFAGRKKFLVAHALHIHAALIQPPSHFFFTFYHHCHTGFQKFLRLLQSFRHRLIEKLALIFQKSFQTLFAVSVHFFLPPFFVLWA